MRIAVGEARAVSENFIPTELRQKCYALVESRATLC
jgi:hypothetical protein